MRKTHRHSGRSNSDHEQKRTKFVKILRFATQKSMYGVIGHEVEMKWLLVVRRSPGPTRGQVKNSETRNGLWMGGVQSRFQRKRKNTRKIVPRKRSSLKPTQCGVVKKDKDSWTLRLLSQCLSSFLVVSYRFFNLLSVVLAAFSTLPYPATLSTVRTLASLSNLSYLASLLKQSPAKRSCIQTAGRHEYPKRVHKREQEDNSSGN